MKNLYLKHSFLILIILFIMTSYATGQSSGIYIDKINIKSNLELLTSVEFEGRLIGTEGNNKTIEYIEEQFKSAGLSSFSEDGYRKDFEAVSFAWNGVPKFNVIDEKGSVVNFYEEGKNFLVRLDNMNIGGNFNGGIEHITDSTEIYGDNDKFKNKAVLIDYEDANIKKLGFSQDEVDDRLYYIGKSSVIIYPESNPIKERNINLGYKNKLIPTSGIIKIGVNKEIYEQLVAYKNKGYILDIDIPISFYETTSSNVYGYIPGNSYPNGNYIIIASSIDSLGTKLNEEHYPEALDNADSISLMLELSRVLASKEEKTDSTIVFAGFNGKHTGSVGAKEYLRDPLVPQEKTEVIYLDKISGSEDSILKINTFLNPRIKRLSGKKVLNQFASIGNQLKMSYELDDRYIAGECTLFRNSGILASSLAYNQDEKLGSILDTSNNISISKIIEVGILIDEYISYYGNDHLILNIGYILNDTWYLIVTGFILFFLKYSKNKLGLWLKSKPIITIYLLISFLIMVLTMQTKHSISETTGVLLQNTNITIGSLSYMLAINIFTTLPMIAYLSIVVIVIILAITILHYFSKKINKGHYFLVVSIVTYSIFMIGFNKFYDYRYSIIYPKLLSVYNSQYIVVLLILLFSLAVTWVFNKEIKEQNTLKLIILFLVVFTILTTFTYSPYVFSKDIVNIRAVGGILKL